MRSTADTNQSQCGTHDEDGVPTRHVVPAESDSSQDQISAMPSKLRTDLVDIVQVDMDAFRALRLINSTSEIDSSGRFSDANISMASTWADWVFTLGGLSAFTATCTMINYLATGYILLPWAFSQGGTLLTPIILGAVVVQTYISAAFVLEAGARAQALELVTSNGCLPQRYNFTIRERKYELSLLTEIFLGKVWSFFFSFTILGDLYGGTWALCSIFASAFSDQFPLGDLQDDGYKLYIAIFMVVSVPLACTSILDQLWLQMTFMAARFLMVLLMFLSVAIAYFADEPHFGSQVGPVDDVPLAEMSNILQVTMTCIFATAFQFSVPSMASVCHSKTVLSQVFGVATTLNYITNILLAVLLALFFGQGQPGSSNLNWVDYHGGTGEEDRAVWARTISGYIVLFAAIDGCAIYSLIAVSLGDIIMGAVYQERVHQAEQDWRLRTVFRLLGSIPQAIGAMFFSDLGVIANYTGIFTILSYTVCPALLALSSLRCMQKKSLPLKTYYSSNFSSHLWAYGLLFVSAVVIVGVAVIAAID
jgi:hypothetical protein